MEQLYVLNLNFILTSYITYGFKKIRILLKPEAPTDIKKTQDLLEPVLLIFVLFTIVF